MKKSVVVFSGKMGSGKDTSAEVLKELWGKNTERAVYAKESFAGPLKRAASAITGIPLGSNGDFTQEQKNETMVKVGIGYSGSDNHGEIAISLRLFLQKLGTDAVRSVWPDLWAAQVQQSVWRKMSRGALSDLLICITDCRFTNEAESMVSLRGRFASSIQLADVKVILVRLEGNPAGVQRPEIEHPSETDLDNYRQFDLVINTEIDAPDVVARKIWEKINE